METWTLPSRDVEESEFWRRRHPDMEEMTGIPQIITHGVIWTPTTPISYYLCLLLLFSHSVLSDSLGPHALQHARLPCPSLSPRVCSDSCPLSQWCHPTISFSAIPFSFSLQSFPASVSFPMSHFFTSGGQSIGVSVSVLPMNIQDWFPLGLTGLISLLPNGLSRVFPNTTVPKASILQRSAFFMVQLSHPCMTTRKIIALTVWTFVGQVLSLLFNILHGSNFIHVSLPPLGYMPQFISCVFMWEHSWVLQRAEL